MDVVDFKGSNGQWLTKALFKEFNPDGMFTIPELREKYLSCLDPTEYTFANSFLGGWPHWKVLSRSPFLAEALPQWREELAVKIRSNALSKIIETASGSSKDAYQAQKYLADNGFAEKQTKGRPSKAAVSMAAKEIAHEEKRISDDWSRVFEQIN